MIAKIDRIQAFAVIDGALVGYIDGSEVCRIIKTSPYDAKVHVKKGVTLDRSQVEMVIKHFELFTASLELVKKLILCPTTN